MKNYAICAAILIVLGLPASSAPVPMAPPGQKELQSAFDAAAAGNSSWVKEYIQNPSSMQPIPRAVKSKLIKDALQRSHRTAKQLYRSKKTTEALNRLQLIFDVISFTESGKAPDPAKDSDYLSTWLKDWHKARLSMLDYIAPLNDYGFFLQQTGNDKEAIKIFQEVVTEDPNREVAYLNLADSLWAVGRQGEANPLYEKYKTLMASENLTAKIPPRVEQNIKAHIVSPTVPNQSTPKPADTVDFGPYMAELQRTIKSKWTPPKMDTSQRSVVTFHVAQDGKVSKISLTKSSTSKAVDDSALAAIPASLPPLPPKAVGPVDIQFTFDYNVFRKVQGKGANTESSWSIINRWFERVHQSPTAENHIGLAQAYMQAKMYQNAESEIQAAVDMDPKNVHYKELLEKCLADEFKK